VSLPDVVSRDAWEVARRKLLLKEKEMTRARDALNAERRRLPMVEVEEEYVFAGEAGKVSLPDLFAGRRQLIVYHMMWVKCPGCSLLVDNIGHLAHLHARDFQVSTGEGVAGEASGVSVFLRDGNRIFHTYSTYDRGTDILNGTLNYLDLTPLGRQEDWEAPRGRSNTSASGWWELHDEY
jgi:predicted dithiol-disulfide oxidoreductase (DUF899 family)